MQIYPKGLKMEDFKPNTEFSAWAAIEVKKLGDIQIGMQSHLIKGGLYAVFLHKGTADTFHKTSEFICQHWIPNSKYTLDEREHFEILTEKYLGPNNPQSEEDVWIPIKTKETKIISL